MRTQSDQSGGQRTQKDLPVDPERLKRQFPDLTADDLHAYAEVTRGILSQASPDQRARLLRDTLARGRQARDKKAGGKTLSEGESLDLRYLQAVAKMQDSTVKR